MMSLWKRWQNTRIFEVWNGISDCLMYWLFKKIWKETDCSLFMLYMDSCINMLQEFCLLPNEAFFFFSSMPNTDCLGFFSFQKFFLVEHSGRLETSVQ